MFIWFFGFLFIVVLISSIFVVNIFNPVHSVFFLILTFLAGSLFFFGLRNEFIAIIFVIVYIGAISVSFLFVIMLLDVKIIELKSTSISYVPLTTVFLLIFFFELIFFFQYNNISIYYFDTKLINYYINWINFHIYEISNVHILGYFLYTYYFLIFIFCSFLLFIATIGAILLTFISLKSTSYVFNVRYEILAYHYFIDYNKTIKIF